MRKTKHWLMTIAALLCSLAASAATYSDWTSTNKGQGGTTSSNTYTITANAGDVLTFDWLVSSESNYDKLIITIGGTEILNKSGEYSGTYQHTFNSSGTYPMEVKYTKDGSVDRGDDYAKVYNITLATSGSGGSGNSGTENIIASGTCGDNLTWKLSDNGTLTIEGTGEMTSCPWSNNYESRARIITVIVGEGVTNIEDMAFYGCSSLTAITLPESVTNIENTAFRDCSSLTAITIPEGVTSIGDWAFYGCSSLTAITLPESVTSIGSSAFSDCSSLTAITLPESVTSIGSRAFSGCSNLTAIIVPEGITSIGEWAFSKCSSLTAIIVDEGNTVYDSRGECNAIIETASNTLILGCSTTVIPQSVTSIGKSAFSNCSSLTSIIVPEGVTSIGSSAFYYCSSLTSITIPESVTSIGNSAFAYCSSLTAVNIPESVTSIGYRTFYGCSSLTSITIPASVTSIGDGVFRDCSNLRAITIFEGVTSIGDEVFFNCRSLYAITLPKGVTSIGYRTFASCESLKSFTIPEGVTSIGDEAFNCCSNLISITIPEGVTSIGDYAFNGCRNLKSITIPEGVTSIGYDAFWSCNNLTSIIISASVTSIGNSAFSLCSNLSAITCKATTPPTLNYNTFHDVDKSIPVYVPKSSVAAYQSAENWSDFTNIQPIVEPAPEEITITMNQYGSATYCSEYALDFSEVEGLKAYAATGYNTKTGIVTLTRVMTSQPGMGLFLKGETGEYIVPTLESTDDNSLNMLVGALENTKLNGTSDNGLYYNYRYTIKEGDEAPKFYQVDDDYTLDAGKAYLQIPVAWMPTQAKAIGLRFDDGGTTDIDELESESNGQNAELIYDLMGRRVTSPQRGMIYIVNGKKVVMD